MKIAIIGKGAWGTAFGQSLERNGHQVFLLGREAPALPDPGIELVFLAVPCQVLRERLQRFTLRAGIPVISLVKGIEITTGKRVTELVKDVFPENPVGAVSGPSLAGEVAKNLPSVLVVACEDSALAESVQKVIHSKFLRTYRSNDLPGIELGGALKNVYAIAGGVCAGLGMGENAMAGLLTRCLAEMVRVGCSCGAKKETLFGLSGLGDLMLTSYSESSRNHRVGVALAGGKSVEEAMAQAGGVAEGYGTTRAVYQLTLDRGIKAPVVAETHEVLYRGKSPKTAMHDLLLRDADHE